MELDTGCNLQDFEANLKVYHDLMRLKVHDILLVFSPYDAFILEEDGSLASRVVSEYHGLNLSHPPRFRRVTSGREALDLVRENHFDLVITMPLVEGMDGFRLGRALKEIRPELPVIILAHNLRALFPLPENTDRSAVDGLYVWGRDPDLLLALIKNVEDRWNVAHDTEAAMVRVLLLVEDSPHYRSFFLPRLYKEVMAQTQAVLDESLNDEHRLLKMRARPKILVAESYEEAVEFYHAYQPYLHGVISDTSFPKEGEEDPEAGLDLLRMIRSEQPDLPLLLLSSETVNRQAAKDVPAAFIDKNDPDLGARLHEFFLAQLGFGDFVFRMPDGKILGQASSLHVFEKMLTGIPDESLVYHAGRNHFSNWIMARSEVAVASKMRARRVEDFPGVAALREYLLSCVHSLRRLRQQGVVVPFPENDFDAGIMDFVTIGDGSMGGKALGLAFMARFFRENRAECSPDDFRITIPRTYVITTNVFDDFVGANDLRRYRAGGDDPAIAVAFRQAPLPDWLVAKLSELLAQVDFPLTVRSSSMMEDAHFRPFAGLYSTYMVPNNDPDHGVRLSQLLDAIRLVYASAYFSGPRSFARSVRQEGKDGMGVIIQELIGSRYGDYFYPAISGVAMSHNFYPMGKLKPEDGVVQIALGFGKTVVEGAKSLRFSPRYPEVLPQFSTVDDLLANSQRFFYALDMKNSGREISASDSNLERREIVDAIDESMLRFITSTYIAEEHRVRDSPGRGTPVLTFAGVLKYDNTLSEWLIELLDMGSRGMGCAVEIEFAAELDDEGRIRELSFLQIRPMATPNEQFEVEISPVEDEQAFCSSSEALGHGISNEIKDIVYAKPGVFDFQHSGRMALEIAHLNGKLLKEERPYLLAGFGRWGSQDHWLGIPVQWQDISGVRAMVELRNKKFQADPSQGTHFFQNITSTGIYYFTVTEDKDKWDWQWLDSQQVVEETEFLKHVRLPAPCVLKVNGRESRGVIYPNTGAEDHND